MNTAIVWLRRDLRLADNPALRQALQTAECVIPVFIHDPTEGGGWAMGSATRWWLHHSLKALDESLRRLGSRLVIRCGNSRVALQQLVAESGASHVFWNRVYEADGISRDRQLKFSLREGGIHAESFNSALWLEPWQLGKANGEPYRVFTPFWKALLNQGLDQAVIESPLALPAVPEALDSQPIHALGLLPRIPWEGGLQKNWQPGEQGALARLQEFLDAAIGGYADRRDCPALPGTSRLSPHLHFGEIGPRQIALAVNSRLDASASDKGAASFLREVGWREFGHHLLFHFPHTTDNPMDARFVDFPWVEPDEVALRAWQRGNTGIPLVDAGMRELWHTGWMHNRVRMVAGSLLTKNLRYHWLEGARWFWDTLVDADLANNTLGWQWIAGCGADAAPYYRIFNPVLQGERFDPQGDYVRRWIPELARLPNAYLHQPWQAPTAILQASKIHLGVDYPHPIVDLKTSRDQALEAFKRFGGKADKP